MEPRNTWTDADFDEMSWHDNYVHGLEIRSGQHGAGELALDIDYIVEWLCSTDGSCQFRIAPATLTFREVTDLRIEIDYAAATAALTPFSVSQIVREAISYPKGLSLYRWTVTLSWPQGAISFIAGGFAQVLRADPRVTTDQYLKPSERLAAGGA